METLGNMSLYGWASGTRKFHRQMCVHTHPPTQTTTKPHHTPTHTHTHTQTHTHTHTVYHTTYSDYKKVLSPSSQLCSGCFLWPHCHIGFDEIQSPWALALAVENIISN